jgi:flagella basal body P-ring formation protein FlgA
MIRALATLLLFSSGVAAASTPRLSADEYCSFAKRELLRALADREGTVTATLAGRYADVDLPADHSRLTARFNAGQVRPRMLVWVDVSVDGRVRRTVPVSFEVSWLRSVLVSNEILPAKLELSAERVALREVNAAGAHGEPLTELAQLQGKRMRREIGAGAVLSAADVEDKPPVEAGEQIDVYATVGRVRVRTVGIAQRDGFNGDRIGVRVSDGKQSLQVRVIGENEARVVEDAKR